MRSKAVTVTGMHVQKCTVAFADAEVQAARCSHPLWFSIDVTNDDLVMEQDTNDPFHC